MNFFTDYQRKRKRALRRATPGPGQNYLVYDWPTGAENALHCPLLSLDFETSGLNHKSDDMISVGYCSLNEGRIALASAAHSLIQPRRALPSNTVLIHGIFDDQAASGQKIRPTLERLLSAMRGRIIVGHHVRMDLSFLAVACRNLGWGQLSFPCIDTLSLMERLVRRRQETVAPGSLTLQAIRRRYGLPDYPAHNALWDAIAAAELWQALSSEMAGNSATLKLSEVVQAWPR